MYLKEPPQMINFLLLFSKSVLKYIILDSSIHYYLDI